MRARPESRLPRDAIERIYKAIRSVPRGRVATYGGIAERAGLPRRARLVGHTLRHAPSGLRLPWHRIINASGRISFPRASEPYAEQRRRLEAECVRFVRGRVNLQQFGWQLTLDELLWKSPERKRSRR